MNLALQIITAVGGAGVVAAGVARWLTDRLAKKLDLKWEDQHAPDLEALKTELERSLYVYKVQFDAELRLYTDLWARVAAVLRAVRSGLEARWEVSEAASTTGAQDPTLTRSVLIDAMRTVFDFEEANWPFFSAEIGSQARALANLIPAWLQQADKPRSEFSRWFLEEGGADRLNEITTEGQLLCDSIRKRVTGAISLVGSRSPLRQRGKH